MIFRIFLVLSVMIFSIYFLKEWGNRRRAIALLFLFSLILITFVAILLPKTTENIANFLGVGRGADLLIYLILITTGFINLILFKRTQKQSDQITSLTRAIAIQSIQEKEKKQKH